MDISCGIPVAIRGEKFEGIQKELLKKLCSRVSGGTPCEILGEIHGIIPARIPERISQNCFRSPKREEPLETFLEKF